MDIKTKFLRCSIIRALDKTSFFFFSFVKHLKAELQYSQFLFHSWIDSAKTSMLQGTEGRWSRWSKFYLQFTPIPKRRIFIERSGLSTSKSSGNVIFYRRSVTQGHWYAGYYVCNSSGRMKHDKLCIDYFFACFVLCGKIAWLLTRLQ